MKIERVTKVVRFRLPTAVCTLLILGMLASCAQALRAESDLDKALAAVERQREKGADLKVIEEQCLSLLKTYTRPEDAGRIYAQIPILYQRGYPGDNSERRAGLPVERVIGYCIKALQHPLDLTTKAWMYEIWGSVLNHLGKHNDAAEYPPARRIAMLPLLTGLKLLLDDGVPSDTPSYPERQSTPIPGTTTYKEDLPKFQQYLAAVARYRELIDLTGIRKQITRTVISAYTEPHYHNTQELRELATLVLQDKQVVDDIVKQVEDNISHQKD